MPETETMTVVATHSCRTRQQSQTLPWIRRDSGTGGRSLPLPPMKLTMITWPSCDGEVAVVEGKGEARGDARAKTRTAEEGDASGGDGHDGHYIVIFYLHMNDSGDPGELFRFLRLFEDAAHLFLNCKHVKEQWYALLLEEIRIKLTECNSAHDIMRKILRLRRRISCSLFALLCCWWHERNKVNHGERRLPVQEFQVNVRRHVDEWLEFLKPKQAAATTTYVEVG